VMAETDVILTPDQRVRVFISGTIFIAVGAMTHQVFVTGG